MTPLPHSAERRRRPRIVDGERGVVLIQVALASLVLFGFCGLVVDYGVMWVARAQAQNAADAGALAAATTLAFDAVTTTTLAQQSAVALASSAAVWGKAPAVPSADVTFCSAVTPACPAIDGLPLPQRRAVFSATVKVYADAEHATALPTYFGPLFGVSSQDVRAQATAAVAPANTTACVWPLAIPDLWTEKSLPPDTSYSNHQYPPSAPPLVTPDAYVPPTFDESSAPTGIQISNPTLAPTLTTPLTLTGLQTGPATPTGGNPWPPIDQSHFVAVQIPRSDAAGFVANLTSCNQRPVHIGDTLALDTGASFAQVITGASTRRSQDPGATWNAVKRRIQGSCAGDLPPCAAISPRLVALPMFDPEVYDNTRGGTPQIRIVNFAGFFIDSTGGQIVGYLATYPGTADRDFPFVHYKFALLRTAILTR